MISIKAWELQYTKINNIQQFWTSVMLNEIENKISNNNLDK